MIDHAREGRARTRFEIKVNGAPLEVGVDYLVKQERFRQYVLKQLEITMQEVSPSEWCLALQHLYKEHQ